MPGIHVIKKKATPSEIKDMLEALNSYIKLAVDVKREVMAGGGMLHNERFCTH